MTAADKKIKHPYTFCSKSVGDAFVILRYNDALHTSIMILISLPAKNYP